MTPIDLLIPDGSLEKPTINFLSRAEIELELENEGLASYRTNQPHIRRVFMRRPQEIPIYLAKNFAHLGITGEDWWLENVIKSSEDFQSYLLRTMSQAKEPLPIFRRRGEHYSVNSLRRALLRLPYSKKSTLPIKLSVLVLAESPYQKVADLPPGATFATEYPWITYFYLRLHQWNLEYMHLIEAINKGSSLKTPMKIRDACFNKFILPSFGKTEQKLRDGLAEAAIEAVETGGSLQKNILRVIETLVESYPVILPNLHLSGTRSWFRYPAIRQFIEQLKGAVPDELKLLTRPRSLLEIWDRLIMK